MTVRECVRDMCARARSCLCDVLVCTCVVVRACFRDWAYLSLSYQREHGRGLREMSSYHKKTPNHLFYVILMTSVVQLLQELLLLILLEAISQERPWL